MSRHVQLRTSKAILAISSDRASRVTIIGTEGRAGTYVLRIAVRRDIRIPFGRFQKGTPIVVPAGEYCYVGSALGSRGAMALGPRLVRHATRSGNMPPHAIRSAIVQAFEALGFDPEHLLPRSGKTLRWNVDYLLDQETAELSAVIAILSPKRLEPAWAKLLDEDPCVGVLERGLGAGDAPGSTHLLRVNGDEGWWARLPRRLLALGRCDSQKR